MIRILLLSVIMPLLLLSENTSAQAYVPFPGHGGVWGTMHQSILCLNGATAICYIDKTVTNGDTLIDNLQYAKLLGRSMVQEGSGGLVLHPPYNAGYLRNDSANKRVYFRSPGSANDTLLYDFNLEIGDTLPTSMVYDPQMSGTITVDQIDSLTINGTSLKRYHLNGAGWGDSYLIEGVGSTLGLFSPIVGFFEFTWEMTCYINYEKMIFIGGTYWCDQITVEVGELPSGGTPMLYPNPCTDRIIVDVNGIRHTHVHLDIYNISGQKIISREITGNTTTIDTQNLPEGLYFARIFDEKSVITTVKICKQ